MEPLRREPGVVARIAELCERDPAREVCGFVVRRGGALELLQVENAADRFHAADPAAFPRTSCDGYFMDPRALLRIHRELRAAGGEIVAVWHSHVEGGASLSATDRADAVVDGRLQLPGADQLVLGLRGGRVIEAKRYRWARGEWVEEPVDLI